VTPRARSASRYRGDTTYEAIKVIEAWNLNFCLGNAVKYICRAGAKGERLTDLQKAAWYLQREIEREYSAVYAPKAESAQSTSLLDPISVEGQKQSGTESSTSTEQARSTTEDLS